MSWDNVYSWSQALAVFFAVIALVSGFIVNKRQSDENRKQATLLVELETNLSKQREKTALAEKEVLDLQGLIKEPRMIDMARALAILDWGRKGTANIEVNSNDEEVSNFAVDLGNLLRKSGWNVPNDLPPLVAGKSTLGVLIEFNGDGWDTSVADPMITMPEPAKALRQVFLDAVKGNPKIGLHTLSELPKDTIVVTIGPKY